MTTECSVSGVSVRRALGPEESPRLVDVWRSAVDAGYRGTGIGSALLSSVVAECGVRTVDVNEQNEQASAFYRRRGFVVIGRSEVDEQGRPYPMLHMAPSIASGTARPVCCADGSSLPGSL